jgi:hypothetical protein
MKAKTAKKKKYKEVNKRNSYKLIIGQMHYRNALV